MRTKKNVCEPGLSRLHGVGAVGFNGNSIIRLVHLVQLEVTFDQDEHASWFQALHELSDGFGVICNLKKNISAQRILEKL